MLYTAQDIILPLVYATISAILLSPGVKFLVKKKINRALAAAVVVIITIIIVGVILMLITSQASLLSEAWPNLVDRLKILLGQSITWCSGHFDISTQHINDWINQAKQGFIRNRNTALGVTLTTMSGALTTACLTPVYIFMILFYQPRLVEFTHQVFGNGNDDNVSEILTQTKAIIQSYLAGLFIEFVIIAILNTLGLLALRIDYALLLGIIGAMLNVIPIVGGVICVLLFMAVALITKSPVYVVYVVALYTIIQTIDNHFIVPKIIGGKVKLNALVCLIAVIAGDALWGIPGMFLSIPLMAIIKLILDHVDSLKPWGFLMGDTVRTTHKRKPVSIINNFFKSN